jgi:hypothetical protein
MNDDKYRDAQQTLKFIRDYGVTYSVHWVPYIKPQLLEYLEAVASLEAALEGGSNTHRYAEQLRASEYLAT